MVLRTQWEGKDVAVKIFENFSFDDDEARKSFLREISIMRHTFFRSAHIVYAV